VGNHDLIKFIVLAGAKKLETTMSNLDASDHIIIDKKLSAIVTIDAHLIRFIDSYFFIQRRSREPGLIKDILAFI
jgi:hypothetical protein